MFQQQLTKHKISVLTFTATNTYFTFRSKYKVDRLQHLELNKNFAIESAPIKTGKYIICPNCSILFDLLLTQYSKTFCRYSFR